MGKVKNNKKHHKHNLRCIISHKLAVNKIIKISRISITQVIKDIRPLEEMLTTIRDLLSLNSSTIKGINISNSSQTEINVLHR